MTYATGVAMLLKVRIGSAMVPVAGMVMDQIVIDSESIDITNKGSQSWRSLIVGGKRTVDLSATGYALDDAAQALIQQAYIDDLSLVCEMSDSLETAFVGTFRVGAFDLSGSFDGAEEFSLTMHSIDATVQNGLPLSFRGVRPNSQRAVRGGGRRLVR